MNKGYMGKILVVDMSRKTIEEESLPEQVTLKKYVGCVGLGMKILFDRIEPEVQPLDPENPLIFMTGPLTGTAVPSPTNWTVVTVNRNFPKAAGTSHSHGFWGVRLKSCGYDGIIIKGAAKKPCYLHVHEGGADLRDATQYWGLDTHDTEDAVKGALKDEHSSVACIGPAGEHMCRGACIANDRNHLASKGGTGAIMGSKKLKAIAVSRGTRKIAIHDREALKEVVRRWKENLPKAYFYSSKDGGITRKYLKVAERGIVAWKNMSAPGEMLKYGRNLVETAKASKVTGRYCYNCLIGCSYDIEIGSGPHKGYRATLTGGGEGTEGAAGLIGVEDGGTAFYLTDIYDRLGLDSSEPGSALALAYECYNRGLISKEDTDGLELEWGNWNAAVELLNKMIKREGFGKVLAEGPQKAAEIIGGDAPKYALHIKGTGYNLHDWRPYWQKLFAQIIATAGPCHHGTGVDGLTAEPDLGYHERQKPFFLEGIVDGVRKTQIKKIWTDCLGICDFVAIGLPKFAQFSAQALSCVTGWDFTPGEAESVGERVINLEKLFSIKRGFTIDDDLNVGQRVMEAPGEGPAKGRTLAPHLKDLLLEYYQAMGWDGEGVPRDETLKKLDLRVEDRGRA